MTGRNVDKYLYIQMELCKKESLAHWLDVRQPPQDVFQMYREILQAVAHLHEKVSYTVKHKTTNELISESISKRD